MPRNQITVDFDEIFAYAKKNFNLEWNRCCDIFHRNYILITDEGKNTYLSCYEIESSLKYDIEHPDRKYAYSEDKRLGYQIVVDFMKENDIEEMYVNNE